MPERVKVYAALLGQVGISAGTYLVAKLALPAFGPLPLLALRFAVAAPVFALLLALQSGPRLPRGMLRRPWELLALACGPLNQGLFLLGLERSTPTHAALLYALTPIGVYLFARVRLEERASGQKVLGIAVAFLGVSLVLASPAAAKVGAPPATLGGDLLILAAVAVWVVYSVEGKVIASRDGSLQAAGWSSLLGAAALLPGLPWLLEPARLASAPPAAWAAVLYLALGTSVLSYVLWYYALSRLEASKVAVFANLQPVVTALLARSIYGEAFPLPLLLGGGLVLAGVALTGRG